MDYIEYLKNTSKLYFLDDISIKKIKESKNLLFGVLTYSFLIFFSSLLSFIFDFESQNSYDFFFFVIGILLFIPLSLLLIFCYFSLFHLILKLFKGKGKIMDTLNFGFSLLIIPIIVSLPFSLISNSYLESLNVSNLSLLFSILLILSLVGIIYFVIVSCRTYSIVHKISQLRVFLSMLVYFFTLILIFTLIILIFGIFVSLFGITI